MHQGKKIKVYSEIAYLLALILLSLAVAILTAADFGISMIVAPAYLLSLKLGSVTFGQAEYIIQAGLMILLCCALRKVKIVYLMSFVTCLIYGWVLDLWRTLPCFDPAVTVPGSMNIFLRIGMFVIGVLLTSFSIALFFKTYLYPQVYDFFVKAVSQRYGIKLSAFKTVFDIVCLLVSIAMTFVFFGKLVGVNWGTLVMAVFDGSIIGFISDMLDKRIEFQPYFKGFAKHFVLSANESAQSDYRNA